MIRAPAHRWRLLPLFLLAVLLLIAAGSTEIVSLVTDLLWYQELRHERVFWTLFWSRLATGAAFGLVFFAIIYGNLAVARRMAPRSHPGPTSSLRVELERAILRARERLDPYLDRILPVASVLLAVLLGAGMSGRWSVFQLAFHGGAFGDADPIFGKDVGFFVFSLPALRLVADSLIGVLVLTLMATAAIHVFDGAIRPWDRASGDDRRVKTQLSLLLALVALSKVFDYGLQAYELSFSPSGQVLGALFTDVHARLPALRVLAAVACLSALLILVNIRRRGWKLPAAAVSLWLVVWLLGGQLYPALVQQFRVTPNEIAAEAPFIRRNIEATLKAFDLVGVDARPFAADERLTAADLEAERSTVENARLWDPQLIIQTYKQLQEIRFYYDFSDVDIDRYVIDGKLRQVLISVRELSTDQLSEAAKTWVNRHLVYTHGYGAVVSPVNESTAQGLPNFLVKDLPPATATDLKITQPAVYFGEETSEYVIVGTRQPEFDYPVADMNAVASYAGRGGVPLDGLLRRALFSLRFGSAKILLSGLIRPESRIVFDRRIRDRVGKLAPWLALDRDPYPAVIDGRIVWILDGYTQSSHYPYSQRIGGGTNYIRNPVKVTVDAYDGTVRLYAFGAPDPVLAAWRRIFPGLVEDEAAMPAGVKAHLRYPEDLFAIQAEVYKTYHMKDPQVFYNKEDQWARPGEVSGRPMQPFHVIMRTPESDRPEFLLMLPFTPRNKDNLIAWMAAKSDAPEYGRRLVYLLPKQRLVLGPEQVSARVNQDPVISQQLALWNQRGGRVLFGNLLVLPVRESILYVQPLYLQAEQAAMPALTRVIVLYGDRLAMEPDLWAALSKVFGERIEAGPSELPARAPGSAATLPDVAAVRDLYRRAVEASKAGDWAAYGSHIEELGRLIERLAAGGNRKP